MSDENQEFDKYGRKIRKGSPLGFLSSMARGGKELPTEKPAVMQSSNEEQIEADAAPEFDKYGRKIRKGASLPILPTVVAIAFVGGITAVVLNETQSGTSGGPKTEAYATDIPGDNIIYVGDDDRVYTDCFSARDDSCDDTPLIEIERVSFNRISKDVIDINGAPFCSLKSAKSQNISMDFCTTRGWHKIFN